MDSLVIGVDVGTGSARAGVFDGAGRCSAEVTRDVVVPGPARPCRAQLGRHLAGRAGRRPRGGERGQGRPAAVAGSVSTPPVRSWCGTPGPAGACRRPARALGHHRLARPPRVAEAEECTASGHRVLDHVGGVISPEMEIPKLMWLKRHLPESWAARRPSRPCRLPHLARHGAPPARMHPHLQVDLPRPRDAGLAAGLPRAARGIPDLLERGGLPERGHGDRQRPRSA